MFLLLACSQQTVTKFTAEPEVAIETPADGSVLDEGVAVAMRGRVTDEAWSDSLDAISAIWAVDGGRICEAAVFSDAGLSECETSFTAGPAELTLTATDPDGQTAVATATLDIQVNEAPTAEILSPTADGSYTTTTPLSFEGRVADGEDDAASLVVAWSSSLDGELPLSGSPTSDGQVTGATTLSAGSHVLTLLVTDSTGRTGQDVATIEVAAGAPPQLDLVAPSSGESWLEGEAVYFEAQVSDDLDDPSTLVFSWSSSLDGVFSSQGASSAGTAELVWDGLSVGTHTITVTATDSDGLTATDSATISVDEGEGPSVEIVAPASGTESVVGEDLAFVVQVADDRTDPEALSLSWESDVDGLFSTQGANSAGEAELLWDGLSAGSHVVTVTATDADGLSGVDYVLLEVGWGEAPEVRISSPTAGTEILRGEGLSFVATVSDDLTDPEDLSLSWESDLDGVLDEDPASSAGSASFYTSALSVGVHTVTLTATDAFGLSATDSTTVVVGSGEAPELRFTSPTDGEVFHAGDPVPVELEVADDLSDADAIALACSSDVDGALWSGNAASDGTAGFSAELSLGAHALSCTATDEDGLSATARVEIELDLGDAPGVRISAPADGSVSTEGEALSFAATVSDDVTPSEELLVSWESDLDGPLSTTPADPSGALAFSTTGLSVGEHVVSLTVTDGDGLSSRDEVHLSVDRGDGPTVAIELPTTGDVYNEGELVVFSATVSDDRTAPTALTVAWTSSVDGLLDSSAPDGSGVVEFVSDGLSVGTHTVTLEVTDGDGFSTSDNVAFVVNGAPSAPTLHISPSDPDTEDSLVVVLDSEAVDPDGDLLSYVYSWTKDGAATSYTGSVPASATTRGEVWEVTAYASDGLSDGPAATASVSIGNAAPAATSVSISPATAGTDTTLSAVPAGFSDPDGDAAAWLYQWYRDGVALSGATDSTLAGSWFSRDQSIHVVVWPTDGTDTGASVSSATLVISDTAPTAPVVLVTPTSPDPGEDLSCGLSAAATDADGDSISYSYAWTRDGVATGYATTTVPGSATAKGQVWTCTVTPSDGTLSGSSASDSVVVDDYTAPGAPVLDEVYAWQNETSVTLTGSAEASVSISLYQGSSVVTTTTSNSAGDFSFTRSLSKGSSYTWYVTATDGDGNVSPASNVVGTEVCSPGDSYEDASGYADSCADAAAEWSTLADDGATTLTIQGNVLEAGDDDWYAISSSDTSTPGINYYRFHVELTDGVGDYAFAVYTGGCGSSYMDCSSGGSDPEGSGWTEYEDYAEESGDYEHSTHGDTRSCYDDHGEYNDCESFATTYYIHVWRNSTAYSCDGYALSIENGAW